MGVLLSAGVPATNADYVREESVLVKQWTPVTDAGESWKAQNDAIGAWIRLFAEHVETICKAYGVPLDVMQRTLGCFQQQIADDLTVLKWAESFASHHDLGWEQTARAVQTSIQDVRDRLDPYIVLGLRLTLTFPFVPTDAKPAEPNTVREVFFPLPSASGEYERTESEDGRRAA